MMSFTIFKSAMQNDEDTRDKDAVGGETLKDSISRIYKSGRIVR